jgi:hypothetical protein
MQRRSLLKLGLGAGAVLTLAGAGIAMWSPGWRDGRLSSSGQDVFTAVARAVLDGSLPVATVEQQQAMQAWQQRLEASIAGLAPATRRELSDLLAMLSTAPGRLMLTGLQQPWLAADTRSVQQALHAMRVSSSVTRQQVFHALRDLTNAAWFANANTWAALGYPGPQTVALA